MENKPDVPKKEDSFDAFWKRAQEILENQEVKGLLQVTKKIWLFKVKYHNLIETVVTLLVAGVLIFLLYLFVSWKLIDKSAFGIMFGTVFGYLLSWRFN